MMRSFQRLGLARSEIPGATAIHRPLRLTAEPGKGRTANAWKIYEHCFLTEVPEKLLGAEETCQILIGA